MTSPTFIAILDFSVSATDRAAATAQLGCEQPVVRSMPGCVDFRVFPAPDSDTGITVLHEWTDQAAFDDYVASDAFAQSGEALRPMMTAAPSSRRFQVKLLETVA